MTVMLPERPAAPAAVAPRMGTTEKLDYCRALAASGLLPAQYRQQPANLLYAVEFADSLGLHPMVAITGVHVIEGRPSASSALISALVRRAGHKLRVRGDATRAVAQIVRADDPEYAFEVAFTLDDAERAGLLKKGVWKQYPASMLKARAITAVARDACEEALFGIHYTPEELGAEVDADGNPLDVQPQLQRQQPGADAWATAQPAPAEQQPQQGNDLSPQARGLLRDAEAAQSPELFAAVRKAATDASAPAPFLARLDRIAAEKWPAEQAPTAEPVTEPLPGAPAGADRRGAVAQLYAAARAAGMSELEARQVLAQETGGLSTASASGEQIAAVTAALREAAGGAR